MKCDITIAGGNHQKQQNDGLDMIDYLNNNNLPGFMYLIDFCKACATCTLDIIAMSVL